MHSAKGSHWKNHKYIKVVDGRYIYPESAGAEMRRRHTKETEKRIDFANAQESANAANAKGRKRTKQLRNLVNEIGERGLYSRYDKKLGRKWDNEDTNERNLNAARNKASRKAGAKRIADENAARARANKTARSQQERGMELTAKVRQQRAKKFRDERNAEGRAAVQKQLSRANTLANGRRAERNAEGRAAAKRQIAAGNNEAARQRKLNAVNTTRAAQKQGMKRTAQVNEQAKINRNKQQKADYDRAALAKKNLSAARAKALRNQRNEEGAASARRQISNANTNARNLEAARNKAARKQTIANGNRAERNMEGRLSARNQIKNANIRSSVRKQGQAVQNNDREQTSKSKAWLYGQNPKNATARRNQNRARIEETAYKAGYKVRKTAKDAGKSISAKARAAWNSAASYKDRFSDYKSFFEWYKKYGVGRYNGK